MTTIAELLIRVGIDGDEVEDGFDDVEESASTSAAAMAAGFGAAGAAIEGLARDQQDLQVMTGRLASTTGLADDEIRDLATDLSNATFPLDEVLGLMELASRQGVQGADDLGNYATFWDKVGDATGESSQDLAKAGAALGAVGIDASNSEAAIDAFGFVTTNTTQSVGDFLKIIERRGPEIAELGLTVDDTAALFGLMESELGLTSRTARQEFSKALNESDGTLGGVLDTLGLTEDQFATMRGEVDGSGESIDEFADVFAESRTPMQAIQSSIEDFLFSNQELIASLAEFAPLLIGVATAIGLVIAAQAIWNAVAAANSVFLIIGAIILFIAILSQLGIGVEDIANAFKVAFEAVRGAVMTAFNWVKKNWPLLLAILTGPIGIAVLLITRNWETIKNAIGAAIRFIRRAWGTAIAFITGLATGVKDWIVARFNDVVGFVRGLPGRIASAASGMWDGFSNAFRSAINFIIRGWNSLEFTVPSVDVPFVGSFGGFTIGLPDIPELAEGGIVSASPGGMLARIGEGGRDEAVIPLPRGLRDLGGSAGPTVVVNVQGSILTERDLVKVVRDELADQSFLGAR